MRRFFASNPLPDFTKALDGWSNDVVEAVSALSDTSKVQVKEAYRDYVPHVDAASIVQQLLQTVPDKYLTGLDCVVLTNETGLSRRDRVGKVWSRKRKFDKSSVLGRYNGRVGKSLPYIELRVDKIIRGLQGVPLRIPILRNIVFGQVLFHEIGHHIHRTVRPEHNEREDVYGVRTESGQKVYTQVSKPVFTYCRWHVYSILVTWPLVMVAAFASNRYKKRLSGS